MERGTAILIFNIDICHIFLATFSLKIIFLFEIESKRLVTLCSNMQVG